MNNYDLWFAITKVPYNIKIKLINLYTNTENIWYYVINKSKQLNLSQKYLEAFINSWDENKIKAYRKFLKEKKINTAFYTDSIYPAKLKLIQDPPLLLYYKGNIDNLNYMSKKVSIVGSRNCTNYGVDSTRLIVKELVQNNVEVISGMAKGIDSIAQKMCVENNGYTCAVLGCGVDVIYPKENYKLYEEISRDGCIISEFPPGTPPFSYNFPVRNRIISGLGDLILIIEASMKSGTLTTANRALEQGKDIMVVPGSIFSNESKGTNSLIKEGADVFTDMEDIFDKLGINYDKFHMEAKKFKNTSEEKIYSVIGNNPIHIDDIIRITNIDIKLLYEVLFEMQLNDDVLCLAGNYYVKVNKGL